MTVASKQEPIDRAPNAPMLEIPSLDLSGVLGGITPGTPPAKATKPAFAGSKKASPTGLVHDHDNDHLNRLATEEPHHYNLMRDLGLLD